MKQGQKGGLFSRERGVVFQKGGWGSGGRGGCEGNPHESEQEKN
jgi:hypothetical protein